MNGALHINFEKIPISIYASSEDASKSVAKEIADLIRQKQKEGKKTILGLATGSSPKKVYAELIRLHKKNVQGGKQRWKMVEPLEDANHVDISDLKSPVVIGRLRHLRGASESMGNGLKKGDNVAFVVVYPDVFTETPDVNDTNADQHSSYRIVKLKYIAKRPVIDVGPALRDFTPCHVKPNDESSALHPQRLNAQAQFATCASSMISAEEFAGFFAMTVDSARRIAADSSNIVRSVAVSELVRAYDAEKARAVETHRSFGRSNYLEWVGTEGLWFTCGLGCCYAKPVTN